MNLLSALHPPPQGGIRYFGNGTADGHGGHGPEHRAEMERIAEEIADRKIADILPQIQAAAL